VAAALRQEPGVEVDVVDGGKGEFTVTVDGRPVVQKGDQMPTADEVLAAVRQAAGAPAGAAG
jgi:hypothetical protein